MKSFPLSFNYALPPKEYKGFIMFNWTSTLHTYRLQLSSNHTSVFCFHLHWYIVTEQIKNIYLLGWVNTKTKNLFWCELNGQLYFHQIKPLFLLNHSRRSVLMRDCSGFTDFLDFSSRLSKLFLETSGRSGANSKVSEAPVSGGFFSASESPLFSLVLFVVTFALFKLSTNFLRCLMYSV